MPDRRRVAAAGRDAADRLPAGTPSPRVTVSPSSFAAARVDLAVGFVFENERSPAIPGLPSAGALARTLTRLLRDDRSLFKGKKREAILWQSAGRFPARRYLLVGLGPRSSFSPDALRDACGLAARRAAAVKARRAAIALPPSTTAAPAALLAEAATEGVSLGTYRMSKYMTSEEAAAEPLRAVDLLAGKETASARLGVRRGTLRAGATNLVRDLVNEPALALTPLRMAEVARRVARQGRLQIKVLGRRDLERLGMGALLGVSAGSHQPPCLIHMIYRPAGRGRPARRVALVGKGLTFDSGGLSLKTATGMETMKLDKAGASAVLGVMSVLPELKVPVEVHGIMGMTENMPGGSAIKPGDVLRTMGGRTIEVLNTDAEGRLVLADCLAYAQRQKVDAIVDLATLTGACMVALGTIVTGLFGNNQALADQILEASRRAGEKMWQLPLYDEYQDLLRSDVADIKNSPGSRYGGAITASLFLKSFLTGEVPWVHLDIAGPAFLESEQGFMRKGATGAAVRTLLSWIESLTPPS